VGAGAEIAAWSFHPRKIITTGEGGMIVTDDDDIAGFARTFRNHGQRVVDGTNEFVMAGDNLRLTDLQGAIGVAQMERLSELVDARGRLAQRYDALVTPLGFEPQRRCSGAAVQSYVLLCPSSLTADGVIATLRSRDVEATVGTNAIPFTRHYSSKYGISAHELPNTADVARRAVTLPLFPQMTEDEQDRVVEVLADIVHMVAR